MPISPHRLRSVDGRLRRWLHARFRLDQRHLGRLGRAHDDMMAEIAAFDGRAAKSSPHALRQDRGAGPLPPWPPEPRRHPHRDLHGEAARVARRRLVDAWPPPGCRTWKTSPAASPWPAPSRCALPCWKRPRPAPPPASPRARALQSQLLPGGHEGPRTPPAALALRWPHQMVRAAPDDWAVGEGRTCWSWPIACSSATNAMLEKTRWPYLCQAPLQK